MHDLLTKLLQANLAAVAAIVLVLLLRKGVRAAFGARLAYALWLLVPIAAGASLAPPRAAEILPAPPVAPAPLIAAAEAQVAAFWTWGAEPILQSAPFDPVLAIAVLWAAGLVLMVGWLMLRQWQFLQLLKRGEAGPAVIGFWKPRIVTPDDFEVRFDQRERTVVLAHEKVHLARQDARLNAFVALVRCVCWFNPLVHIAAHVMRIDQEVACDAAVVQRHPKARASYAQALLKAQLAARPLPLGCYWPAGTEHPLMERIAMLKQSNPSMLRRFSGAALIAILSAGSGYAAWAAAPAAAPAVATPLAYVEEVLAPDPELTAPQPQAAPKASAPRPAPAQAPTEDRPVAAADVCLSNACAEKPLPILPPPSPFVPGTQIRYVGKAQIPAGSPFARYFDADSPVMIKGQVTEVRMTDGMSTDLMVQGEDGKLYRVIGGDPARIQPDMRAAIQATVGKSVNVRGYLAFDKTCEGGCVTNGRDVTYADGSKIGTRPGD